MLIRVILLLLLAACSWAQNLPAAVGKDISYQASGSDNLYSIARNHRLGLEHLAFANKLPVSLAPVAPKTLILPLKRVLPINPPEDGMVLNLPERGIFLFKNGQYKDFYPVAIGGPGWTTPVGEFSIKEKIVNPTWYPPGWAGVPGPVGPGPANPLGDRWMGLDYGGYGLHSTNRPNSIGAAISHGCIRLYPEMVRELYEEVEVGMPIRIEYEPIKLGLDEQGQVILSVFPDVYHRLSLHSTLADKIGHYKLKSLLQTTNLSAHLKAKTGIAISIGPKPNDPDHRVPEPDILKL